MTDMTRRDFMKGSLVLGTGFLAPFSYSRVLGANEEIRAAVVGINGRGRSHIRNLEDIDGVSVVALCDVDRQVLDRRAEEFKQNSNREIETYTDIRQLLERKDIDVISIASCNHWHSLMTVWACQAGKDVYVEKPCSHNVFEGRQCVDAARRYGRIVQHGTQSRDSASWANMVAAAKSGKYGKLLVAKGYCCKPRWSIGQRPVETPPDHLDFDLWLGPAPQQDYHGNLVHYNWHWFWDFGNGDMGNQGVHEMDKAYWALEPLTLPRSIVSLGGRWVNEPDFKDQAETPNMLASLFDYGDVAIVFETRGLVENQLREQYPKMIANEYYTSEGVMKENGFYPKGKDRKEPLDDFGVTMPPGNIFGNFIHAVRSRKSEDLHADILKGHYSSALCHLGNISYRLGEEVPWQERPEPFKSDTVSQAMVEKVLANTEALGVDPNTARYRLGPVLEFDPEKEDFVNHPKASQLLSREYREPFVVPKQV